MSEWISVKDDLPIFQFYNYGNNSETSQSVELSDGENLARGHLDSKDGWVVYESEYDYFYVDPDKITHWMPLINTPL